MNSLEFRGPLMILRFPEPQVCWSWAVVNGGRAVAPSVAWYFTRQEEYPELIDPVAFLQRKLAAESLDNSVGLLTSRERYGQVEVTVEHSGLRASCVATVGLSNRMRIGDPPTFIAGSGTINLVCHVSQRLTPECALEALAIAAEARTAAVMDTFPGATGTGTDCIVLAHPVAGDSLTYAGKHTVAGHCIGRAVYDAIAEGVETWPRRGRPYTVDHG